MRDRASAWDESDRPQPVTEDDLSHCPACGSELEWEGDDCEFVPTIRSCPEHGDVTIEFQPRARSRGYKDFEGNIKSPEWRRCPSCAFIGVEIPEATPGWNVYFECPQCGQEGIV